MPFSLASPLVSEMSAGPVGVRDETIRYGLDTRARADIQCTIGYGNYSAQWKTFIDRLGGLWMAGALQGKYFGVFVSTGSQGGGQEATAIASLSSWVHQGMVFVSLGYGNSFPLQTELQEVRGGSPWGAGTFAGGDGSRQPTAKELELAEIQGKTFYQTVAKVNF